MRWLRTWAKSTKLGARFARHRATQRKHSHELAFWRGRFEAEGPLTGPRFYMFYTDVFGLTFADYSGKRILDLGCGPRGTLEWATMAAERVGLDPLADEYRALGTDRHGMRYVTAPSERIPFPDHHFDFVSAFNSLDHVDDLDCTIREIKRVVAPGGHFLLIVEIGHQPTPTEPITLDEDVLREFAPEFETVRSWTVWMSPEKHDGYGSVLAGEPARQGEPTMLCAHLTKAR